MSSAKSRSFYLSLNVLRRLKDVEAADNIDNNSACITWSATCSPGTEMDKSSFWRKFLSIVASEVDNFLYCSVD